MARAEFDWSALRGAALLLAGVCVVSGGLLWGSRHFATQMKHEYQRHHQDFLAVSKKYIAVGDEEQIIRTYLPQYDELTRHGVVGPEKRLDWMEALRAASEALKLPSVRYDIHPQEPYPDGLPAASGRFRVYASRMTLTLGLLHEADLLRLLHELRSKATGLFTVEECLLRRVADGVAPDPGRANVNAECSLAWTTIRQPAGAEAPVMGAR